MAIIDAVAYGVTGPAGDYTTQLEAAIAACAPGDLLTIPDGDFGTTRTLFPVCSVRGSRGGFSRITSLPALTSGPAIDIADRSGITISDLGFKGSGQYTHIGAIKFGGYTQVVSGITIKRCTFEAIKSPYWVLGRADFATYDTIIKENKVKSVAGDALSDSTNHAFCLFGSLTGSFVDTRIRHNSIAGTGISIGVALFGSHRKFFVTENEITDMGLSTYWQNSYGAVNSYPIMAYALGATDAEAALNTAAHGEIIGNLITRCTSAGIYGASVSDLLIANNSIRAQNATDNALSTRGAISLNTTSKAVVTGNLIHDCAVGINIAGGAIPYTDIFVSGNHIRSGYGGPAVGIRTTGSIPSGMISLMGNQVELYYASSQAFVDALTGGKMVIRNNASMAGTHGLAAASTATREVSGNTFMTP